MAGAKDNCAEEEYHSALRQYRDLIGSRDDKPIQDGENAGGVFNLLNPHHGLTPLADYVVPLFQGCGPHHIAKTEKAERSRGRWSRR
jgi:hypothetical protein